MEPLTEVEKAHIVLKLKELRDKSTDLQNEHTDKKSLHMSAAGEYGSELCAGGMINEESQILKHKELVDLDIDALQNVLDGNAPFSTLENII